MARWAEWIEMKKKLEAKKNRTITFVDYNVFILRYVWWLKYINRSSTAVSFTQTPVFGVYFLHFCSKLCVYIVHSPAYGSHSMLSIAFCRVIVNSISNFALARRVCVSVDDARVRIERKKYVHLRD